jgi:hypothetical protein
VALPNFICVGAEKGGTTPLWLILAQHPDVFVSPQKETRYFTRLYTPDNLILYETYFFKGYRLEKAIGELTPDYMRYAEVAPRLRGCLGPELKLIFCLRDPLKRAFSHYLQCVRIFEESESFESAVSLEAQRIAQDDHAGMRRAYVEGSLYTHQIRRFLEHFPRENMFFMILEEDFLEARASTVARLFDFLGVAQDPRVKLDVRDTGLAAPEIHFVEAHEHLDYQTPRGNMRLPQGAIVFTTGNKGGDRVLTRPSPDATEYFRALQQRMTRELPEAFGAELYRRHFADEISRCEELLGRDLSLWRR